MRPPTVDDLTDTAKNLLERDYRESARRGRCSREDFSSGWMAAAIHAGRSFFRPEAWPELFG